MKKGLKIMGVCLIVILNAVCFCSCLLIKDKTFVYDDYFVCSADYGQPGQTAIVELTDLGKEQEVLIIPETINGQKVLCLGGYIPGLVYPDSKTFSSIKLKKLYIPFSIKFQTNGDMIYVQNATVVSFVDEETYKNNGDFITLHCRKQALLFEPERMLEHMVCANCFFYINEEMVWADYIADGEVYALPAYLQINWYLEPDCINLWNGEYVIPNGQEQLNLYSK